MEVTSPSAPAAPPLEARIVSIDAGASHTCAVTEEGQLLCWGAYASDGLTQPAVARPAPVGTARDWTTVDVGDGFTCGLKSDKSLWCFASNEAGFASAGQALSGNPMRMGTQSDWQSISLNDHTVCGIRAGGQVYCVGKKAIVNAEKFGHEVTDDAFEAVEGLSDARSVSHSLATGCAVRESGKLWCWGLVAPKMERTPVRIGSRSDWQYVEMNTTAGCASTTQGEVYCWLPEQPRKPFGPRDAKPTNVTTTTPEALTVGRDYACAPTEEGWKCWGSFASGQRGPGVEDVSPSLLPDARDWATVTAGGGHTCGLKQGRPHCWGDNGFGQLGNGIDGGSRGAPAPLDTTLAFRSISSSVFHACGITDDDELYCWGENGLAQFDDFSEGSAASPRPLFAESKWRDVAVSGGRNFAIRADGTLWTFGFGEHRQVTTVTEWRDVERGGKLCATKTDDSLWCWLDDLNAPPTKLAAGVGTFGVGYNSVCGHLKDGTSECFQLRPASSAGRGFKLSPARWKAFDAATSEACGITDDGVLGCFEPYEGEPPSPLYSTSPRFEPLDPKQANARWLSLSIGDAHSCAIRTDNTLWCWGFDRAGALGLGDVEKAKEPTQVGDQTWSYVKVGDESTCGITTEGKAHCWGRHYIVGDGRWLSPSPQPVVSVAKKAAGTSTP